MNRAPTTSLFSGRYTPTRDSCTAVQTTSICSLCYIQSFSASTQSTWILPCGRTPTQQPMWAFSSKSQAMQHCAFACATYLRVGSEQGVLSTLYCVVQGYCPLLRWQSVSVPCEHHALGPYFNWNLYMLTAVVEKVMFLDDADCRHEKVSERRDLHCSSFTPPTTL